MLVKNQEGWGSCAQIAGSASGGQNLERMKGERMHAPRSKVRAFQNSGSTLGKILGMASPGGLDDYLETISPISIPRESVQE